MDPSSISLEQMKLSVRSYNALHRAGFLTLQDVLNCTEEKLFSIPQLGRKSVFEIQERCRFYLQQSDACEVPVCSDTPRREDLPATVNYEEWLSSAEGSAFVLSYLDSQGVTIDSLSALPARTYNILRMAGCIKLSQIIFCSQADLLRMPYMDIDSAQTVYRLCRCFLKEHEQLILSASRKDAFKADFGSRSFTQTIREPARRALLTAYLKRHDDSIDVLNLHTRSWNCLMRNELTHISDIIFLTSDDLVHIRNMGQSSVEEVFNALTAYLQRNEKSILNFTESAEYVPEEPELTDDSIRESILALYRDLGFSGLSFRDFKEKLAFSTSCSDERLKAMIGSLLADHQLEYVDFRCYRVYPKFKDVVAACPLLSDEKKEIVCMRLEGKTLAEIAQHMGLTRERIRQITKKCCSQVHSWHLSTTGLSLFDEDYYVYLYSTYLFEKKDAELWLGFSADIINYMETLSVSRGTKDLTLALEDHEHLSVSMRLKIKNYLNRNRLYLDGMWVKARRSALEQFVITKFCTEKISFSDFADLYNQFLRQQEIPYDEALYYTEDVLRSCISRISTAPFTLWSQHECFRYYDINGRDYTELLDTLQLDSYENTELSTQKFIEDYPEVMSHYDIRDRYELHNLLRKIVPAGSYHDFRCGTMPTLKFGEFDRTAAIFDILIDLSPITVTDLVQVIHQEYGFDEAFIASTLLAPFSAYYHKGVYSIDQPEMSAKNMTVFQAGLTQDFYFKEELVHLYAQLCPNADPAEINPYNLKRMGFQVYCRYVLQHHSSLEAFFVNMLTEKDIFDITEYRKRFGYVVMFSTVLSRLKASRVLFEFEPNQYIQFSKLAAAGITYKMIDDFCDEVAAFVPANSYFNIASLRAAGFQSELYDLGFSDLFYAGILFYDKRFSYTMVSNAPVLYSGTDGITIRSFLISLICAAKSIDILDLMAELENVYGCSHLEKSDILIKVEDSQIYYDDILERLYANADLYYQELDELEDL